MKYEEYQGDHLKFITVEPNGFDPKHSYPLVVLLHGFGAHMGDLAGLAPAIDSRGYVYVFPNAPILMHMTLGGEKFAWAPIGGDGAEEALNQADCLLTDFLEEVINFYNPPQGEVVLGGFSQGGLMAYRGLFSNPKRVLGIAALSAIVPDANNIEELQPSCLGKPIFACHGTGDTLIPVNDARRGVESLRAKGYDPDYKEYSMGHEITLDVIGDLTVWLHKIAAPAVLDSSHG